MSSIDLVSGTSGLRRSLAKVALALLSYALLALCAGCQEQGAPVTKQKQQSQKEQVMSEKLRQDYVERKKTTKDWLRVKEAWLADVRRRYQGIDASANFADAPQHGSRFGELMREWNPIHCSVDDLKSIAGEPTRETQDVLEYVFDSGAVASAWRFKISAGTILGVEYVPGD